MSHLRYTGSAHATPAEDSSDEEPSKEEPPEEGTAEKEPSEEEPPVEEPLKEFQPDESEDPNGPGPEASTSGTLSAKPPSSSIRAFFSSLSNRRRK